MDAERQRGWLLDTVDDFFANSCSPLTGRGLQPPLHCAPIVSNKGEAKDRLVETFYFTQGSFNFT